MPIPTHGFGCKTKTYPTKCKVCRKEVFHFSCSCGSSILFNTLNPFELHVLHPVSVSGPSVKDKDSICIRLSYHQSKPLKDAVQAAVRRWRRYDILAKEPERISSLKYMVWLKDLEHPSALDPLSDLFLIGIIIETITPQSEILVVPRKPVVSKRKADHLCRLAQRIADKRPLFFEVKGPSAGDHDTADFMRELRSLATKAFDADHSEKKVCGQNNLCVDFYFPDEETIVEVALGLRNPTSEYERDILKAIMAKESGNPISHLMFISKSGAAKRLAQPGAASIAQWAERNHGIKIEIRELARIG